MKLILENWRRFLKEADTLPELPFTPDRQTVPQRSVAKHAFHAAPTVPLEKEVEPSDEEAKLRDGFVAMAQAKPSGKIQIHNATTLFKYFQGEPDVRQIMQKGWTHGPQGKSELYLSNKNVQQFINYLVVNNPIFQQDKIVKHLGAGSFGFVVELANTHALKVFVGSHKPLPWGGAELDPKGTTDVERFRASSKEAFEGTAGKGQLQIFDEGEIETPFDRNWFYAEMPPIITISSEMIATRADTFGARFASAHQVIKIVDNEILFLKELAYLANLVDEHGVKAIKEYDPEARYAVSKPGETKGKIEVDPSFGQKIRLKWWPNTMTSELIEFSKLLKEGDLDTIFETLPRKYGKRTGLPKIKLLDKTYAKNLFEQLRELLKTKTLRDIHDIRSANIGFYDKKEDVPIIFDY